MNNVPTILFFINDTKPTDDQEKSKFDLMPCNVLFRNANYANDSGALEHCDGVHGDCIPSPYEKAYPKAEDIRAKYLDDNKNITRVTNKQTSKK